MSSFARLEKELIRLKRDNYSVFASTINEDLFVWRLLTRQEYEIITKSAGDNLSLIEEMVCQVAVMYPDNINFGMCKAGIPTTLSGDIIELSGFGDQSSIYDRLDSARLATNTDFVTQAESLVAAAFPQYRFEEMRDWNIEQLLDMVARAEWKLNTIDDKEIRFNKPEPSEDEEEEPKSEEEELRELEGYVVESGGDPILQLQHLYKKKSKDFTKFPFIMGVHWDNEEVLDEVRRQQQERRRVPSKL